MSDNYDNIDVESIANNAGDDVSPRDVEDQLALLSNMHVPADEAAESVRNHFGIEQGQSDGVVPLSEAADEQWTSHRVRVQSLIPNDTPSIDYTFRVADEQGTQKKVTVFNGDFPDRDHDPEDDPLFEVGDSFEVDGAVGDEYDGTVSLVFRDVTNIEFLDDGALTIPDDEFTVTGLVTDLQDGSGLIKRCPVEGCSRVIRNGDCPEHGPLDQMDESAEFDMRLKLIFNTGSENFQAIINDLDLIEALTGYTIESAQQEAMERLDTEVVSQQMAGDLLGAPLTLTGRVIDDRFVVNDVETVSSPSAADLGETTSVGDNQYIPSQARVRTATELDLITTEYKKGDDEKSPVRAEAPAQFDGPDLSRVLVTGALTVVENLADADEEAYLRAELTDAAGNSINIFAGQYQQEARSVLSNLEVPERVLVLGKPRVYTTDDETRFKLVPEAVLPVEQDVRQAVSNFAAQDALSRLTDESDDLADDLDQIANRMAQSVPQQ